VICKAGTGPRQSRSPLIGLFGLYTAIEDYMQCTAKEDYATMRPKHQRAVERPPRPLLGPVACPISSDPFTHVVGYVLQSLVLSLELATNIP
jgi:hypothetical protein